MIRWSAKTVLIASLVLFFIAPAHGRKPEDVFAGQIILSTKPFPYRFKSDRAFVRHMKKVRKKAVYYPASNEISLEFMAFFGRAYAATEYTCLVYNLTERNRMVTSFPIYPESRNNRILASGFKIKIDEFPEERHYQIVISLNGQPIAQTKFAIKENTANRKARKAREKALKKQKMTF